jgi:hypothetical protein
MLVSGQVRTELQNIDLAVTVTLPLSEWQNFSAWYRDLPESGYTPNNRSTYPAWAIVGAVESLIRKITSVSTAASRIS